MEKKDSLAKFYRWKGEVLIAGALLVFAFLINAGIEIHGLYGDDLTLWSDFHEMPFWKFMFPIGQDRFPFLYYIAAYIQMALLGNHITWFVPFNIIINGLIAYTVFHFARCVSKNGTIGFLCGMLYLVSGMSCYQISQVYGLMESLGLWLAVCMLYCLFQYVNEQRSQRPYLWIAYGLYFGICFVHERYVVLVAVLLAALVIKKEKKIWNWLILPGTFALIQLIHVLSTKTMTLIGHDGGGMARALSGREMGSRIFQQFLYLVRVNTGDQSLCGLNWQNSPRWVRVFVIMADLWILALFVYFLVKLIRDKAHWRNTLCNALLFLLFMIACMAGSSVSGQVQPCLVYVSMTAFWIFLAYLCGVAARPKAKILPNYHSMLACTVVMVIYFLLMAPVERFYRGTYPNLSFWNGQQQYNSLAEQTYEKYGASLFGKKIYILKNSYGLSEEDARTFFSTFNRGQKREPVEVTFVNSIRDFGQVRNNMLILQEDTKFQAYQDITGFVKNLKCEPVYGYYPDEWMGETAKIRVMAGETGSVRLQLMYPGMMTGEEVSTIYQDGVLVQQVKIVENITYVDLETEPFNTIELDFENNFYTKNAYESSEGKRLAMMMRVTTD